MVRKRKEGFFASRRKSFQYAFNGLLIAFKTQLNIRIHLISLVVVVVAGVKYRLNYLEWSMIIVAAAIVIVSEIINTSIEFLCDYVSQDYQEKIGKIKDLAAGAVLLGSISALIIGLLVFLPKIIGIQVSY